MSDSLRPHEPQHARPPCPSPTPGVHPNPHPLSWWCHPTISSSVVPFSSCPQSFPSSGSFQMSQLFASNGQIIGASVLASVLPMNIQGWFLLGLTGLISLLPKELLRVFSSTTIQKASILWCLAFFKAHLSHQCVTTGKITQLCQLFGTPRTAAHQASPSFTISWILPKFMSITSVMPSSHLILWCPLLLPSVFPSIRDFSNESTVCIRWPKYWSFSFSISPSNEYSELISFRID